MKVLFVCVHNAGRSQMAAAFFNVMVDPSKAKAIAAGTQPGTRVHPEVAEAMQEIGIDMAGAKPQLLTEEITRDAQMAITMGCGDACPYVPGVRIEDWPFEDPKGKPLSKVREIRDAIRDRVQRLMQQEGLGHGV